MKVSNNYSVTLNTDARGEAFASVINITNSIGTTTLALVLDPEKYDDLAAANNVTAMLYSIVQDIARHAREDTAATLAERLEKSEIEARALHVSISILSGELAHYKVIKDAALAFHEKYTDHVNADRADLSRTLNDFMKARDTLLTVASRPR